jgi:uncharacterized membrane protein
MQPKRSKYDTNPLDKDVSDRAEESWSRDTGSQADPATQDMTGAATRDIARTSNEGARNDPDAEAATRRIDDSYPSVFVQRNPRQQTYEPPRPTPANIYQAPPVPPPQIYQRPSVPVAQPQSGARKVAGLGIPEKWAAMLPYVPFWPAIIIAVVELLLVPRTETRVRFHASQALAIQIGVTAISLMLTFGSMFTERWTGAGLFNFASFILLLIAMIKVWKGKPVTISLLDEPRKWLDEKIKPRK